MIRHLSQFDCNLLRGDHSRHGEPVPDPLGHGDDVGHHAVALEAPVVLPRPPEPGLDLLQEWSTADLVIGNQNLW